MKTRKIAKTLVTGLALCLMSLAVAEELTESSEAENEKAGFRFLPIPILITEPAIGEGLGVALTMFHPPKSDAEQAGPRASTPDSLYERRNEQKPPPVATAVFGAYTSNQTWAAGIAHSNHFRRDTIRYTGAVAFADVTSDFYVAGAPVGFKLEGALTYQDLRFRIGHSRIFVGSSFVFLDASNSFELDLGGDVPETLLRSDLRNAGLAAAFIFEGRDNSTMPTRGQLLSLKLGRYDEALGGDYEYWNATLKFLSFHPLHERFVLGLRLQAAAVDGSPPFFGYPWVTLRGVPAMRYQDKWVGAAELEARFLVAERWALLGFGGQGFTADDLAFVDEDVSIGNFGAGIRSRIFSAQNVWVGVDIAKGPEEWNWYLQVNQAW